MTLVFRLLYNNIKISKVNHKREIKDNERKTTETNGSKKQRYIDRESAKSSTVSNIN